ncbi:MAG: lysine exporter protein LysE/YggA [uncultured bacterium]|nr:MAG: lysine exporter protein LysE/YggA [uncultured bacterium]
MQLFWLDLLTLLSVHILGLVSPGPDFAVTVKQSLSSGKRAGYLTALGIGVGCMIHMTYCILGLGFVITQSVLALNVLKYAGAAYLTYIGIKALRTKKSNTTEVITAKPTHTPGLKSFRVGLITNLFNPKATLFFLSLFTIVMRPGTALGIQFVYAIIMALLAVSWFMIVSTVLTLAPVQRRFKRYQHWIDRTMGAILVALGVKVATSKS